MNRACLIIVLFASGLAVSGVSAESEPVEDRISVALPPFAATVAPDGDGQRVTIDGFGGVSEPGAPRLPVRIFPILLPAGAQVIDVGFAAESLTPIPGSFDLTPAPIWEPIGFDDDDAMRAAEQQRFAATYESTYSSDELYPARPVVLERTGSFRGYDLVDVRVMPVAYRPVSRELVQYHDLTIHVDYRMASLAEQRLSNPSAATAARVRELVLNQDRMDTWYPAIEGARDDDYDFFVITAASLEASVAPLVAWEQQKGRTVNVVTTEWIAANHEGVDLPERIRNFLRSVYEAWGIEYVLLVGDQNHLPMREVWQDLGYGNPWTDMYYAELSRPDRESWDADNDGHYAEEEDLIDFYPEVCVGRIPWSDPATVLHICEKSVLFEQATDPGYKRNCMLLGGFYWPDTDCAIVMETIAALPHLSTWTDVRMYEWGYSMYGSDLDLTNANVVSMWAENPYAVVTWCGHGSYTSAHRYYPNMPAFIQTSNCPSLDDNHPSIVFADSCRTSSPLYASLGRRMLEQGAIGYVGATEVAGGRRCWESPADGSSQTLNYLFFGYVTSGDYTQGEALQRALLDTYHQGAWRWPVYEVLEWVALYGNPDLGVADVPWVHIQFPAGRPAYVQPGAATGFTVRIDPVQDSIVPDSAQLHYRFDEGPYTSVPLVSLEEDLYEAVLPAAPCGDEVEYFVSAVGAASGLSMQPPNAPVDVFAADVGVYTTVFSDDFETSTGWMVENLGATDGLWERGIPVDDPNWPYDPATDGDGSGQCALTANRLGNSDVDNGGVRLTSPVLDLTGPDPLVRYRFYLYAEDQSESDYLLVEVSNQGLAGPWHEVSRHERNNGLSWRTEEIAGSTLQSMGIPLTDQMHVRFTAYDVGADNIVEAGLDGFEVLNFECVDPVPGDIDGDHDVDLSDWGLFVGCLAGPDVSTPPAGCSLAQFSLSDLDTDGNVDLADSCLLQASFVAE